MSSQDARSPQKRTLTLHCRYDGYITSPIYFTITQFCYIPTPTPTETNDLRRQQGGGSIKVLVLHEETQAREESQWRDHRCFAGKEGVGRRSVEDTLFAYKLFFALSFRYSLRTQIKYTTMDSGFAMTLAVVRYTYSLLTTYPELSIFLTYTYLPPQVHTTCTRSTGTSPFVVQ